jgi:sialic acid synthase SpsE
MSKYFNKLFILEIANNHNGDVNTALEIIKQAAEICEHYKQYGFQFAIKLQYRDLDTFIHPDFKGNHDYKFVKRFEETRLSWDEFKEIKDYIKQCDFISACTPFDEPSLAKVIEHDFDIIKIASCSFTDWPLLEEIVKYDKPIIASCGAAELEDIDKVVSFMQHRNKDFALLHCVPEYPTEDVNFQLGQIKFLKNRYDIPIGFSSHFVEGEDNRLDIEISLGAQIFERHIKLDDEGNDYSISIDQLEYFIMFAMYHYIEQGETENRYSIPQSQKDTIRSLQRGVYAKIDIEHGETLTSMNTYLAMPLLDGQLSANDLSKYKEYCYVNEDVIGCDTNTPIMLDSVHTVDKRSRVLEIVRKLVPIIKGSGVVIPDRCELELSHHYGIEEFETTGAAIFNIINKEYCKKIIVMLPNQIHPEHYHNEKTETFNILFGTLYIPNIFYEKGDMKTLEKEQEHSFGATENGCVFEEISTTHFADDSYYTDEKITKNKNRKTKLTFYKSWLSEGVK